MSSNFVKGFNVRVDDKKTVKIDANDRIARRLEELAEQMKEQEPEAIAEGFSEGLDADMVERLVSDTDEGEGEQESVIHPDTAVSSAQAQAMIDEAKENADQIIEDAKNEAAQIEEDARRKGYSEGFERGRADAEIEEREKYERKVKALEAREQAIVQEYEKKAAELEPLLVNKLSGIFEKVTGVRLENDRETIVYLLRRALTNLDGARNYIVHVSASDYDRVQSDKEDIAKGTGILPDRFEIIEDVTLKTGDCMIESDGGIWDCGLGTQMELLVKQLKILSYEESGDN
ncbi:MAG: hypothetical protein K6C99_09815 [Lachnospiraceae bacterium]|nr:hypothetical protein [Lachnospiraceae bacterium]